MTDALDLEPIRTSGLYYLRRLDLEAEHPVLTVGDDKAMLVYSSIAKAQAAADDLGGADVLHEPDPKGLFIGLPEGASKLLLDYDPDSGEGWLLSAEDFAG